MLNIFRNLFKSKIEESFGQVEYIEADEAEKEAQKNKDNNKDLGTERLNQEDTASEK